MEREEAFDLIMAKITEANWHWLSYHFLPYKQGCEHFLAAAIVDSLLQIETCIPGFTEEFSTRLASLSGREKFLPHYEQIIQLLSELYVIRHLVLSCPQGSEFIHEPKAEGSEKNPEVGVTTQNKRLFFEVKCRQYIEHHNNRGSAAIEIPSRMDGILDLANSIKIEEETIVLPRDNGIKDFLISAEAKFSAFKKEDPSVLCILVIAWDDFAYEPISSLLNHASGLLTERSFYKENDSAVQFNNIDGILIVRLSHQLVRATRDELPVDGLRHPLDWGRKDEVLPKAFIPVSELTDKTEKYLCDLLEAHHIKDLQHVADYRPQELVFHV